MKSLIFLGSSLLSSSLFAMEKPQEIVLHFNDGQDRTLSAQLAQHIPELTSCEQSSEVDFSLLSSSDWDVIKPLLPFIKDIRTSQTEEYDIYGPTDRIHLDTTYQSDNMAHLFLYIKKLLIPELIQVMQIANFLQITEMNIIAQSVFLKKLKKADQFNLFIKETYHLTADIQQNMLDIASLNWNSFTSKSKLKKKSSGSYNKSYSPFVSKHIYFIYDEGSQLLKAKKREIHHLTHYQSAAQVHYLAPKIPLDHTFPTSFIFIESLFLNHLKKCWKQINVKDNQRRHKKGDFLEIHSNNSSHNYCRLMNPKYQVQVCKHTYPDAVELYNSLNQKKSSLLKTITTTSDCISCAINQEKIAEQFSLDNWIETNFKIDSEVKVYKKINRSQIID